MTSKRSKLSRTLAAVAITACSLFSASSTVAAQAGAPAAWECGEWSFCIYSGAGGTGSRLEMRDGVYDLGGVGGGVLDNNVHSVKNISGDAWCLYDYMGYEGLLTRIQDSYTGPISASIGEKVTSVQAC
ncbi:hypothetical protein SGFS_070050 [Streptomyces graminofaciens]|uniref:Peptidase inhibitor family I36 n=1 Tax=Streptomyces graminofaciens TaxID=68212 RepID=A0ABM7FHG5_9ACTN|nr:peptidase inhibitor family I36 protein [Streptomyces graminofaciens]BBC35711.1 hypothetical protein SGFS_070050 [Streptomyces graminofaciens]